MWMWIFLFPIVTPPLTWLFLLEHHHIWKLIYTIILLQLFEGGWGFPATCILGRSQFQRDFPIIGLTGDPPPPQNGSTSINLDQHEYTYSAVARTLTYCCTHSNILLHARYTGARTVYWRTQARGKRKNIMRFEIRYFFLEVGLSSKVLTQKCLISNLIICFRFPRACVRNYTI